MLYLAHEIDLGKITYVPDTRAFVSKYSELSAEVLYGFCVQYVANDLERKMEVFHTYKDEAFLQRCEKNRKSIITNLLNKQQRTARVEGKELSAKELESVSNNFTNHCKDVASKIMVDAVLRCRKKEGCFKSDYFACGTLRKYIRESFKQCFGKEM